MKNQDAVMELLNQRDSLNSIGHLLLNQLERAREVMIDDGTLADEVDDIEAVIELAKKSLLPI